jgi:Abortive infection C-terminus
MFADEFESDEAAPVDLERAKELVLALCDSLIAGTTASQTDAKPDQARYRRDRSQLGTILKRAGIREPFPWPRIAEALAAAKTEHYGNGSHRKRTQYFQSRAQNVLELLDTRIADRDSGNITAAIGELQDAADLALLDTVALRRELARAEAALPVDASTAISKAKTLMEVVAKRVIIENGAEIETDRSVSALTNQAAQVLGVDRKSVVGYDTEVATLLQKLHSVVNSIGELRNSVGADHGPAELPAGLDLRYGRLAMRSAIAWSGFMLDTLHDRRTSTGE